MKRVNLILISFALPIFILVFGVTVVSAKGGSESAPQIITVGLSEETTHLGGTVMATASFTPLAKLDNYTAFIDWGDGAVHPVDVYEQGGSGTVTGDHLYTEPGQYGIVWIVIMPDGDQMSASAILNVMSAQETIDWLIENVGNLVHDNGLTSDQGQSLVNQLEAAQAALDEEQTEEAVGTLEAYLDELIEYIDAGLVPKEDPSPTIIEDMANILLADPRPSPQQ